MDQAAATQPTAPTHVVGKPFFEVQHDPSRPGRLLITAGYNTTPGQQQNLSIPAADLPNLADAVNSYLGHYGAR